MLDVNVTGLTSNLSDITEGYELWLLDDMTLAVTYFYNMKVRSKDKFEAVTYRYFMKDGLYKFGYDFEEDASGDGNAEESLIIFSMSDISKTKMSP